MKPHQLFFYQFRSLYRPFTKKLNVYLAKHQLYSSQWGMIHLLMKEGPLTVVDIADRQNIEKPTASRLVQRLKELGYVETIPGKDRREKKIQLSDAGEKVCAEILETIEQFQKDALEGISEEEQLEASRLLAKVRANLLKRGEHRE